MVGDGNMTPEQKKHQEEYFSAKVAKTNKHIAEAFSGIDGSVKWPMKEWAERKRLKWTLKTVDIDTEKLSEGLGHCPKNPQGTRPLTRFAGAARTRPRRKQASKHTCWPWD